MLSTMNSITLPFMGAIDLSYPVLIIFLICLLSVLAFEFVNGFHDTANAVATVIYTKALKPNIAVPWSGIWNFLGVFAGGVAVAMGILKLVPLDELMNLPVQVGACLVLAVLLSSIIWNLGTWYLGIPCSSSHTLIGALIGGSIGFTYFYGGSVNWGKAEEIGLSLILSPIFGFGASVLLMFFLKNVIKAKQLFHIPQGEGDKPPFLIRILLITTCTLVSFFHGSNDGQKGVGLLMLILITFLPAKFAIDHSISNASILKTLETAELPLELLLAANTNHQAPILNVKNLIRQTESEIGQNAKGSTAEIFKFRKDIEKVSKEIKALSTNQELQLSQTEKEQLALSYKALNKVTDFSPLWVIAAISISLGLGTMIGWKRIVVTIGEKIGNEHLNYAQGATAELVGAATIGLSTGLGLPVSTTHVLSSGIAGAMVAQGGAGNLNNKTLKSIAMAWVLTLPVCIVLSLLLFTLFRLFL
ncbi:PiT family inorganic phosphate transporter [Pedobacter nutrimenti]|uniref:Phosphate transporter n=2 Tax=Pedobacter nutrimenti TaxID=1241337 RepID=A0A318ULP3_9SPHI|nr:PiT family inorganic phosphate transporter [Pedobacter nutrimenti]